MHRTRWNPCRLALLTIVAAAFAAAPASAQSHRSALTWTGGGSVHGDLAPGLTSEALFEPGWITGLQLERWLGSGRMGLRLNTLWTQRRLNAATYANYNVVVADIDMMLRLREARPERVFSPFIALGAGATHYGGVAGTGPIADGAYGDPTFRAHLLGSIGFDLGSLRIEVGDQVVLPSIGQSPAASGVPQVHNLVATMGLQLQLGSLVGPRVRMARAEEAPPVRVEMVEPEPEPEPELDEKDRELAELRERVEALERAIESIPGPGAAGGGAEAPAREARPERPAPEPANAGASDARFTVQVGSFIESATADRWVERLRDRNLPVWRSDTEVQGQRVSRVRVGALATEAEARTLAATLQDDYGWPVWVDGVRDDEAVPADAVPSTLRFLARQ